MTSKIGPIGKGFAQEVKTKRHGTRYVARWNAYEQAPDGVKRVQCGPHELGPKVSHGPGLKSLPEAQKKWDWVYRDVFKEHHAGGVLGGIRWRYPRFPQNDGR